MSATNDNDPTAQEPEQGQATPEPAASESEPVQDAGRVPEAHPAAVAPVELGDLPTPPFGFPLPVAPSRRRSLRKVWLSLAAAALVVVVVAVGYTLVRYLIDNSTYDDGHAAYERADCGAAIGEFDSVITSWKLVALGDTVRRAESEKAECLVFQAAADRQQAGDSPGALTSYVRFLPGRAKSPLTEAARGRVGELFGQPEAGKLATVESCETLSVLRDEKLLVPASAPAFYAACGAAFNKGFDKGKSLAAYSRLFSDYSGDKVAAETEAAMLADTGWCLELEQIRKNPVLAALKDLLPGLLSTCAAADTTPVSVAIENAKEFLTKYPGHRFAGTVNATYAKLINKQVRADIDAKDFGREDLSGTVGGNTAVLLLYNDANEPLRIAFSGPEPRVEEIAACADCPIASEDYKFCRKQATLKRVLIAPGEYDVALDHPEGAKTPGAYAHWSVQAGKEYFGCFTIVERPR